MGGGKQLSSEQQLRSHCARISRQYSVGLLIGLVLRNHQNTPLDAHATNRSLTVQVNADWPKLGDLMLIEISAPRFDGPSLYGEF
jgi:hypothetical protein